jgi:GNAT superfamily N-acetyltransferase
VRIIEAILPDDLEQFRSLMDDYLVEFDRESDPREYWDEEYFVACEAGIAGGTHIVLFAVEGEAVLGFVIGRVERLWYRRSLLLGHVEELYVAPANRRHGVARALVAVLRERFALHGIISITASVLRENERVLRFWESVGLESRAYQLFGVV